MRFSRLRSCGRFSMPRRPNSRGRLRCRHSVASAPRKCSGSVGLIWSGGAALSKSLLARRRLLNGGSVPIQPNLAQWLSATPRGGEKVWPHTKPAYFDALAAAAKRAGVRWKQNGLRHSYISYRLAAKPDIAAVAIEAGNSPTSFSSTIASWRSRRKRRSGSGYCPRAPRRETSCK